MNTESANDTEMTLDQRLAAASERGRDAGRDSALTYLETCGYGSGSRPDSEDCPDPLSGEWSGESIPELLGDLLPEDDYSDTAACDSHSEICDAYEESFREEWISTVSAQDPYGTEDVRLADVVSRNPIAGLTYVRPDPYGYRDSLPELGGSYPYGSWGSDMSDKYITAAGYTWAIIDLTGYSDYSGSVCERSNCEAIREEYPESVCTLYGGYGTEALMIPTLERIPRELINRIRGLADYPVYDEEAMSALEMKLAEESWDAYLRFDLTRELREALASISFGQATGRAQVASDSDSWPTSESVAAARGIGEDLVDSLTEDGWARIRSLYYSATYEAPYGPECEDAAGSVVFPFSDQIVSALANALWDFSGRYRSSDAKRSLARFGDPIPLESDAYDSRALNVDYYPGRDR